MSSVPLVAGRYRIIDRLGQGGLGVVYRVEDQAENVVRALKLMPRGPGKSNLRAEFSMLSRLAHPNIVRVFDYGVTARGDDWFTMELVEGPPLDRLQLAPTAPGFAPLVGGVLSALAFLHARGLVHADIKPSNILVDAARLARDPAQAARLADFGLSAHTSDPEAAAARGTFPYAAPEVYAGRVDARSDLYAFGMVLYELVTGERAYPGADVAEVIRAQRRGPPRGVLERKPGTPPGLAELITALVEPEPSARLQSADEALARVNALFGTEFAVGASHPALDVGGTLVGRERDLAQLHLLWEGARSGLGAVSLVAGEEGIGKTRLTAELKLRVQLAGARCYGASALRRAGEPYAGLAPIARAIMADFGEKHGALVEPRRAALAPVLGERGARADVDGGRFGPAEALARLVLDVSAVQPLAIIVDDLESADPATLDVILYLARAAWAGRVLLVLVARDGGHGASPALVRCIAALAHVERCVRIDLPPLDRASVRALVRAGLGDDAADVLAGDLHRASGGNPELLGRALGELVASGALARRGGHWQLVDPHPVVRPPDDALAAAKARLAASPEAARRLLAVAGILGERVEFGLLAECAAVLEPPLDAAELPALLAGAAAAGLVEAETGGDWCFAAAGVRELAAAGLPGPARKKVHEAAAAALAARARAGTAVTAAAVAEHAVVLADRAGALAACLAAADELAAAQDHHGAQRWLERALGYADDAARGVAIPEQLGDARAALGDIAAAVGIWSGLLDAGGLPARAELRVTRKLAELLRRRGQGDEAVARLMRALGRARAEKLGDEEAAVQLALGRVRMYRSEYPAALEHLAAGLVVARAAGATSLVAQLLKTRADVETYKGDARAALEHAEAALEVATGGPEYVVADVLHTRGRASIHAGDYARAVASLDRAIAIDQKLGRVEQEAKALNNLGAACYFQGDWDRARSSWERFRHLCERIDETTELVNALNNLGSLYRDRGELSEALAALDRGRVVADRAGAAHMAGTILGNRGETLVRRGDLAAARECYERCARLFTELGAKEDMIETRRRLCELDVLEGAYERALETAMDAAREAQAQSARLEEGALHRVAAQALRLTGDLDTAAWFLERAREIATQLGARYERARVDLEEAELNVARHKPAEAEACLGRALEGFAALGARWDLARARDRRRRMTPAPALAGLTGALTKGGLGALLEVARAAGGADLDRLLETVLDKFLELVNFERGFILLLDERGRATERMRRSRSKDAPEFDRQTADFSGSIVRRVVATGEPVTVVDVADDVALREQRSVISLGLRSVMCVPVRQRGRIGGIIYVDSRRLPEKDPAADLALLEALATLAGLAIDNARLLSEERRKAELMGILAHEIRNPLAGILGYSEVLPEERERMPADAATLLERIHRDAQRLKRLVDNVLEVVRVEAGKVEWSMATIRMGELLEDARAAYAPLADKKGITLTVSVEEALAPVAGNADRLFQVLSNLVGNALKFTPEGGRIELRATNERVTVPADAAGGAGASGSARTADLGGWLALTDENQQRFVRVDVTDSGPGVPPEKRELLFQKFGQTDAGKRVSRGVGLGLFISREIIQRHGGDVWVESEPGKGSTFSFRIPCVP